MRFYCETFCILKSNCHTIFFSILLGPVEERKKKQEFHEISIQCIGPCDLVIYVVLWVVSFRSRQFVTMCTSLQFSSFFLVIIASLVPRAVLSRSLNVTSSGDNPCPMGDPVTLLLLVEAIQCRKLLRIHLLQIAARLRVVTLSSQIGTAPSL